jgi:Phasin protein
MAKSTQPVKSSEPKGVASAPAARRATPTVGVRPARSEARPQAPTASDQGRAPEPIGESAPSSARPAPAAPAALDPVPAPLAESALGEPNMAPPAEVKPTVAEPSANEPPASTAVAAELPEPVAAAPEPALATAEMRWPGHSLVEASMRIRGEMIAFTWRQTEHGLALGRAILASRSLPELLALQTTYLGETLERTLAHTLELTRLSSDMLRAGLQAPRAD